MSTADDDLLNAMGASSPAPSAPPSASPDDDPMLAALSNAPDPTQPVTAPKPPSRPIPRMARHIVGRRPDTASAAPLPEAPAADQSWSSVAHQALNNFVPSFEGQVKGMVEPLLPQNWGNDVKTVVQLGRGLGAKAGLVDANDPAKQKQDEALVNAIGGAYASKYGTVPGFKQALAQDPASFLTDAATAASLFAGGAGLAAKAPGVVGDAASAAADAANAVAKATNPLSITARAASAVLPGARVGARLAGPAARAVETAFPSGEVGAAEIAADPQTAASLRAVMAKKGVTPAAAKEGLLR